MKDEGGRMKVSLPRKVINVRSVQSPRILLHFILHPSSFILSIALIASVLQFTTSSIAQTQQRSGAHSTSARDTLTASDRRLVERAIGATCAERIRDPLGSMPIDQMQARPSL